MSNNVPSYVKVSTLDPFFAFYVKIFSHSYVTWSLNRKGWLITVKNTYEKMGGFSTNGGGFPALVPEQLSCSLPSEDKDPCRWVSLSTRPEVPERPSSWLLCQAAAKTPQPTRDLYSPVALTVFPSFLRAGKAYDILNRLRSLNVFEVRKRGH